VQNSRFSEAGQKLHGVLNGCAVNVGQRSNANDEVNYDWTTKIFSPEPTSPEGAGPHIRILTPGSTTKKAAPLAAVFDEWAPRTSNSWSLVTDYTQGAGRSLPALASGGCPSFPSFGKLGTTGPQRLHLKPSSEPSSPLSAPRSPARSHALRQHNADSCSMPIVAAPVPALASQDCDACIATSLRAFSR
jgi:hypothetical protein